MDKVPSEAQQIASTELLTLHLTLFATKMFDECKGNIGNIKIYLLTDHLPARDENKFILCICSQTGHLYEMS